MNYRLVLKTYTALRQLTDEESALLTTLRNMSESEQELMVETLSPQSKSAKKPGKKSGASKSKRASGMAQAIKNSIGRAQASSPLCVFIVNPETNEQCNARDDDSIHDPSYLSSHLFVHPDQQTQASAMGGD